METTQLKVRATLKATLSLKNKIIFNNLNLEKHKPLILLPAP